MTTRDRLLVGQRIRQQSTLKLKTGRRITEERMSPRRVLQVLKTAEPAGTAIFRMVESLVTAVDPSRYEIEMCFLRPGKLMQRVQQLGIRSTCVNWDSSARDPRGAARYAALLWSGRFCILHQHIGGRLLTGIGRWLTHAYIVRSLHARASEQTGIVPRIATLPERDVLIANSQIVADHCKDSHAVVIYPGIDVSLFPETRRAHQGMVVGTACRLEPVKGLSYLLQAVAALTREFRDVRLEIAGEGSLRASLEQESRQLGLSGRITFLGWRDDLPSIMAGWDLFVMPSLDEGFGLAVLEAMAAGLPVIASAAGGICELVQDGETGWLVPPANPDELALRARALILDHQMREAMGIAGRERALRQFPLSRMTEQTIAVYEGLFVGKRQTGH